MIAKECLRKFREMEIYYTYRKACTRNFLNVKLIIFGMNKALFLHNTPL